VIAIVFAIDKRHPEFDAPDCADGEDRS